MANPVSAAGAYAATQRLSNPLAGAAGAGGAAPAAGGPSFADTLGQVLDTTMQAGKAADRQALAASQGRPTWSTSSHRHRRIRIRSRNPRRRA